MRLFFVLASALSFGVLLLPSRAQQPGPATQTKAAQTKAAPPAAAASQDDGKPALFTTSSRLVVVDVTVKDKSGNTINGLKQSDFAVFEDGQKQKSRCLRAAGSDHGSGAAAGAEAVRSAQAARDAQHHHYLRSAREGSIPRQTPDGVVLRFLFDGRPGPVAGAGRRA